MAGTRSKKIYTRIARNLRRDGLEGVFSPEEIYDEMQMAQQEIFKLVRPGGVIYLPLVPDQWEYSLLDSNGKMRIGVIKNILLPSDCSADAQGNYYRFVGHKAWNDALNDDTLDSDCPYYVMVRGTSLLIHPIPSDDVELTSGTLTIGDAYYISTYGAGDDFSNVGASQNAAGVAFVATGTTPTTWSNGTILRKALQLEVSLIDSEGDIDESTDPELAQIWDEAIELYTSMRLTSPEKAQFYLSLFERQVQLHKGIEHSHAGDSRKITQGTQYSW